MSNITSTACQVKQVAEQHLSVGLTKCLWSPKMDLLLTSNTHGHVLLQRHRSLQRVWQLLPHAEHTTVTGLAWRPDSNLIAVGYHTGLVMLVTLESGTEVHSFEVGEGVTSLSWHQYSQPVAALEKDMWSEYMTPLPASDKWFTESHCEGNSDDPTCWQNNHVIRNQDCLTLLVVGTANSKVLLYAFGFVHCATVELSNTVPRAGAVIEAQCSDDMNLLSIIVERPSIEGEVSENPADYSTEGVHVTCDIAVISEHHKELYLLARKHAEIQSLINYATDAINRLREAWEGILLEMDTKLDAYSGTKEEGEVSADFLDLLVFGYSSPEFHMFLSNKLSEKGLKKLRQTVELGYTNMHKLVVKQLEAVGQGLVFVISQMLGMARRTDRYGQLGVEESVVCQSLKEAGAFLLKTGELQQVIGTSVRDFLAFIKWLAAVHLRINGLQVTQELAKTTQQETSHIMGFLHDTLEEVVVDKYGNRHRKFRLEGVGQYLSEEELKTPVNASNNPWLLFLQEHPEMQDLPLILPPRRNESLIQNYNSLSLELTRMAERSVHVISQNIRVSPGVPVVKSTSEEGLIVSQCCCSNDKMNAIIVPKSFPYMFFFYEWSTDLNDVYLSCTDASVESIQAIGAFYFSRSHALDLQAFSSPNVSIVSDEGKRQPAARIIGAQFYSQDILSVLTQDFGNVMRCLFVQVPVGVLRSKASLNLYTSYNSNVSDDISVPACVRVAQEAYERDSSSLKQNSEAPLDLSARLSPKAVRTKEQLMCSTSSADTSAVLDSSFVGKISAVDLSEVIETSDVCRLDVAGGLLAVSGKRKVAAVVASHRRTVVLYETEVDDDEDDDEEGEVEDEERIQEEKKE